MEQNTPVRIEKPTNRRLGEYKKQYKFRNRSAAIDAAIRDSKALRALLKDQGAPSSQPLNRPPKN